MSKTLTPAYSFAQIGNALNDLANSYKIYNDPNATQLEQTNAAINAAGAALTMVSIFAGVLGKSEVANVADIVGITPATGGLGTAQAILINSISEYKNNPSTDNLNLIIQATGDVIAAGGGELAAMGALTENPLATEWGIGIQTYGNAITAANKAFSLIPTAITDPIFSIFDSASAGLQNAGNWLGGFTYNTIQAIAGSTPANINVPPVINNPNGSVTTEYSNGTASTQVTNANNSSIETTSVASTYPIENTSVIDYAPDGSISGVTTNTVNGDGTYTIAKTDANGSVTSTTYTTSNSLVNNSVINTDGSSSDTSYFYVGYQGVSQVKITNADGSGSVTTYGLNGNRNSLVVTSTDGSTDTTEYNSDGSIFSTDVINANGTRTLTNYYEIPIREYFANGVLGTLNSETDTSNSDGSAKYVGYNADGSGYVQTINADGSNTYTSYSYCVIK